MKKFLSMLLVLCLMLVSSSALAQTVSTELMKLDNGISIVLNHDDSFLISSGDYNLPNYDFWLIENGENAAVSLNIAPSEIDSELSLSDLTEEQQMQYAQEVGFMFADPEIHLDTTPSGNMYLHVCSNEEDDIDTIFTIYKGCFVELIQYNDNFAKLTAEDTAFCLSILHGIEFVAAE